MDSIHSFAPVIIPTLCRYDHFKLCIESLMRCTHAENTDVFIGLDYPAKEEHWDGYRKISDYLKSIEKNAPFKSLNIIRRERNYGLGKDGNTSMLVREVLKTYDFFILSEDDNVFSPAFLDYINRGLQIYKDDERILAICGYSFPFDFKCADGDTVFFQNYNFSAWGYGIWKSRTTKLKKMSSKWFRSKGIFRSSLKIAKDYGWERTLRYLTYLNYTDDKFPLIDVTYTNYMILENIYVVVPRISLVRNIGFDGSGENFKDVSDTTKNDFILQPIYEGTEYPIVKEGSDYFKINNRIFADKSPEKLSFFKFFLKLSNAAVIKLKKILRIG